MLRMEISTERPTASSTWQQNLEGEMGWEGMVHGIRSLGSATMDLAYTAMGSFDIWWQGGCWEWDVAAGICFLEEAGGLITTSNPPSPPRFHDRKGRRRTFGRPTLPYDQADRRWPYGDGETEPRKSR